MKGDKAICAYCGQEFIKNHAVQIYCCTACKKAAYYKKHYELFAEYRKAYRAGNRKQLMPEVYNPFPITEATILMTIRALEKGESIDSIERETHRRPGQLQEVIAPLKENGKYDKIAAFVKADYGLGNKGLSRMPVRPGTRKITC